MLFCISDACFEADGGELYGSFDDTYNSYRNNYIYYLLTVVDGGIYDTYVALCEVLLASD